MSESDKIPWWRNISVWQIVGQVIVLAIVIVAIVIMGNNLASNFRRLNLSFGFNFLDRAAGFGIGNPPVDYRPTDPYTRAILVGIVNSVRVMFWGIIIATVLGVTVGIARLSDNWLVRKLATIYVEILRNTPLLLQLFFWYFAVFLKLPQINNPLTIGRRIFLTNRGLDVPWLIFNQQTWLAVTCIVFSLILALISWRKHIAAIEAGREATIWLLSLGGVAIACSLLLWLGIDWSIPQFTGRSITGGLNLSPELATLLIGLSIYTAAFIAEVVRAGIQSVDKGQIEAAKALGLKPGAMMQLIIFPQALRVIIPPLTSEFLNLAKNSSLAIAIGYSDVYAISNTIANQTGRSVEMLVIIMGTYLIINLIISAIMNWFNALVQFK